MPRGFNRAKTDSSIVVGMNMTEQEQRNSDQVETERNAPSENNDDAFVQSGDAATAPAEPELAQAIADRDRYLDNWHRSVAELENVRKRMLRELDQERQYRSLSIARDFLPTVDNLQRALQAAEKSQDVTQLVQGIRMVLQQFDETLVRHSITPIPTVGEPFDPNLHEAVLQQPNAEMPPMTVLMEVEKGYKMHDRVVRPSKVIVSSAPAE